MGVRVVFERNVGVPSSNTFRAASPAADLVAAALGESRTRSRLAACLQFQVSTASILHVTLCTGVVTRFGRQRRRGCGSLCRRSRGSAQSFEARRSRKIAKECERTRHARRGSRVQICAPAARPAHRLEQIVSPRSKEGCAFEPALNSQRDGAGRCTENK